MADTQQLMKEAMAAFKAKKKSRARELLMKVTDIEEDNVKAWLLLSAVVDKLEDQQLCLENVLTIDPNNEKAKKGLAIVRKKLGLPAEESPPPTTSAPSASPTTPPASSDSSTPAFTNDALAGTGFDASPWQTDINDPALGDTSNWDDLFATTDATTNASPFTTDSAPPTSVEWGQKPGSPSPATPPATEDQETTQYDDWINNLGINKEQTSSPEASPFATESATSADDTDWSVLNSGSDPFGNPAAAPTSATTDSWDELLSGEGSPFGGDSPVPAFDDPSVEEPPTAAFENESPWGETVTAEPESPFGTVDDDPFGSASDDPFGDTATADDPFASQEEPSIAAASPARNTSTLDAMSSFDDDEDPFDDSIFASVGTGKGKKASADEVFKWEGGVAGSASPAALLAQIPSEIKPAEGKLPKVSSGGSGVGLMLSTLILLLLNIAAVAFLFMNMSG